MFVVPKQGAAPGGCCTEPGDFCWAWGSRKCEVQVDTDLADGMDMPGFSSCQKSGLMCVTVPRTVRAEARPSLSV